MGSCIPSPAVWYKNNENIELSFLTIPFEDIFYGLELILLNIFLYEYFKIKLKSIENEAK